MTSFASPKRVVAALKLCYHHDISFDPEQDYFDLNFDQTSALSISAHEYGHTRVPGKSQSRSWYDSIKRYLRKGKILKSGLKKWAEREMPAIELYQIIEKVEGKEKATTLMGEILRNIETH